MSRSRHLVRYALAIVPVTVALTTVGATVAMAQPAIRAASPATALQITSVGCSPSSMQLPGQTTGPMHCTTQVTGGTTPYVYQWSITQGQASVVNNSRPFTSGSCTYGQYFTVSVTVTDATRTRATKAGTDYCDPSGP